MQDNNPEDINNNDGDNEDFPLIDEILMQIEEELPEDYTLICYTCNGESEIRVLNPEGDIFLDTSGWDLSTEEKYLFGLDKAQEDHRIRVAIENN